MADGELLWLEPRRSLYGRLENAGFSVVGHLVFTKTYTSKADMWAIATNALTSWQKGVRRCSEAIARRAGLEIFRQSSSPEEKPVTSLQPLIESFTHPNAMCWTRLQAAAQPVWPPFSPDPVYRYRAA